jgi:nucleoside-diphosphate-sugar epimerase
MNPIRKIAIIGATGMLGIPVTAALLDAGFAVTALSRKPN